MLCTMPETLPARYLHRQSSRSWQFEKGLVENFLKTDKRRSADVLLQCHRAPQCCQEQRIPSVRDGFQQEIEQNDMS